MLSPSFVPSIPLHLLNVGSVPSFEGCMKCMQHPNWNSRAKIETSHSMKHRWKKKVLLLAMGRLHGLICFSRGRQLNIPRDSICARIGLNFALYSLFFICMSRFPPRYRQSLLSEQSSSRDSPLSRSIPWSVRSSNCPFSLPHFESSHAVILK